MAANFNLGITMWKYDTTYGWLFMIIGLKFNSFSLLFKASSSRRLSLFLLVLVSHLHSLVVLFPSLSLPFPSYAGLSLFPLGSQPRYSTILPNLGSFGSRRPGPTDCAHYIKQLIPVSWFYKYSQHSWHNETIRDNRTQSMVYAYIETLDNSKDNRKIRIIYF